MVKRATMLLSPSMRAPATIDVAVFTGKFLNDGDVRLFTDRKCAEFGAMNFAGGIHGGVLTSSLSGTPMERNF